MTIVNGYATLIEFTNRFFPSGVNDHLDDTAIENVIEAVSRQIDGTFTLAVQLKVAQIPKQ